MRPADGRLRVPSGGGGEALRRVRPRLHRRLPRLRPVPPLLPAVGRRRVPDQDGPGAREPLGGEDPAERRVAGAGRRPRQGAGGEAEEGAGDDRRRREREGAAADRPEHRRPQVGRSFMTRFFVIMWLNKDKQCKRVQNWWIRQIINNIMLWIIICL